MELSTQLLPTTRSGAAIAKRLYVYDNHCGTGSQEDAGCIGRTVGSRGCRTQRGRPGCASDAETAAIAFPFRGFLGQSGFSTQLDRRFVFLQECILTLPALAVDPRVGTNADPHCASCISTPPVFWPHAPSCPLFSRHPGGPGSSVQKEPAHPQR